MFNTRGIDREVVRYQAACIRLGSFAVSIPTPVTSTVPARFLLPAKGADVWITGVGRRPSGLKKFRVMFLKISVLFSQENFDFFDE